MFHGPAQRVGAKANLWKMLCRLQIFVRHLNLGFKPPHIGRIPPKIFRIPPKITDTPPTNLKIHEHPAQNRNKSAKHRQNSASNRLHSVKILGLPRNAGRVPEIAGTVSDLFGFLVFSAGL